MHLHIQIHIPYMGPGTARAAGGRAGAHVRYMYLYMCMHMYMYMHYVHTWTRTFFRVSIQKNLNIEYIIESWHYCIWQKRRAPKNAAFWRASRAEISHMRPIQARKLKLFRGPICDKSTLMYLNCIKKTKLISP